MNTAPIPTPLATPYATPYAKRLLAWSVVACLISPPAFAGVTDISNVPLASGSQSALPNLLFTLDDSGSMVWDYLPDYVGDNNNNNGCMTRSGGSVGTGVECTRGDPPFDAGGENGFNGVAYDPNLYYAPGVDSTGRPYVNPPSGTLDPLAVTDNAYVGGTIRNLTTYIDDKQFCNANNVCKRNGADTTGAVISGTDGQGNTMGVGQFPYRTNPANSSTAIFGLPEMMSMGSFTRSSTTATANTIEAHGLTTSNYVYVTGTNSVDVTCVAVTGTPTVNSFTYTTSDSGTVTSTTGSFRKCVSASFSRSSGTVTVTSSAHGLVTGDIISVVAGNADLNRPTVTVTRSDANTFTYTMSGSATASASGYWVRGMGYSATGTFSRSVGTVTVSSTAHGLTTGDLVTVNTGNNRLDVSGASVTVVDANTFTYSIGGSRTVSATAGTWTAGEGGLYNVVNTVSGVPHSYWITPIEYCTDPNLTDCVQVLPGATAPAGYTEPAYTRFCQTQAQALAPGGVGDSAGTPRCRGKYVNGVSGVPNYIYPRYGWFNRDTITSGVTSYANRPNRSDCTSAPTCTYTEEIQNYARWYAYYRTRMQMMKSAVGRAFLPFIGSPPSRPNMIRTGFITINAGASGSVASSEYLKISDFNTSHALDLYTKFYAIVPGSSTPLREALSRAGWIFAGKLNTGLTSGIPTADDPAQLSCQRNFSLLTTDGYWNGNGGQTLSAATMGNMDAVDNRIISPYTRVMVDRTTTGTLDGAGAVSATTQPETITQQVVCSANNNTAFGRDSTSNITTETACGCTNGEHRIKQRTIAGDSINSATPTNWAATFQDYTACSPVVETTTTTPVTRTEQVLCTGSATASFAGGLVTQACGCAANYSAVHQAVSSLTNTLVVTDGTQTSNTTTPVSVSNTTISLTTACNAVVTTTTTPKTERQQVACVGSNATTFPTGGSGDGGQTSCGCSAGQGQLVTRTLVYPNVVVTTGGVQTSNTNGAKTSQSFAATSCTALASTNDTVTGITVVQSRNCVGNASGGTNTVTFNNGATQSCSCGTSSTTSRHVLIRQTLTGVTANVNLNAAGTVTAVNSVSGGSAAYDYSVNGSTWSATAPTGSSCAAGSTTLNGTGPTGSGGTLSAIGSYTTPTPTLSPNPTITSGTSSSSSTGSTPAITLSPNPTTANGTASSSSTGTALTITLSPNPNGPILGTTTTTFLPGGTANTLADVAMYYYQTDLRGGTDVNGAATGPSTSPNTTPSGSDVATNSLVVKSDADDFVTAQHMVTFTIGLIDGLMRYQPDYAKATNGDFYNIKTGAQDKCFWTSGTCNWPAPAQNMPSALDDLWHAAVNGRGQYYQASNANSLDVGLQGALSSMGMQVAAAAASATSSPNVTQTNNSLFSTTYETSTWSGKVFAQTIDATTGDINAAHLWDADILLLQKVADASDTRALYTFDSGATSGLKPFDWASLSGTEQSYFADKCNSPVAWSQCASLTAAQLTDANNGQNLVNFLRGQTGFEATLFRDRIFVDPATNTPYQTVLGDTMDAKPIYVGAPTFSYVDSGYSAYSSAQASRAARVYVGANDGYLHAFDAGTGVEAWAYTPKFLMQGLYQLANFVYGSQHAFFVDGSPTVGDVYDTTAAAAWKTILVGGVNGGGKGFYALDVTDPNNPKGLWEFCADSAMCTLNDADLGLSFGNPLIGKRASDGKWVVVLTSGLNNASGVGYFYVLDAITGAVLDKVSTAVGTPTTPSGLMKASAYHTSALTDATFSYVYAGDQLGNVWRLDVTAGTPAITKITTLKDSAGRTQPITTIPELTLINTDRVLFIGTGRYLGVSDLADPGLASGIAWQQSIYAFKDRTGGYTNLRTDPKIVAQTLTDSGTGTRTVSTNPVSWTSKDGWYVDLNPSNTSPGERVNIDPKLVLGTLIVATNTPTVGNSCSVGGSSMLYNFDFMTGSVVPGQTAVGVSLGGSIVVGMAVVQLPSGAIKDIVTTADTKKTSEAVAIGAGGGSAKRFSYRER